MSDHQLPHNQDAEIAVLAACLFGDPAALVEAMTVVKEDDFHSPRHRTLFHAIRELWSDGVDVDPLTLKDALTRSETLVLGGGAAYIGFLVDAVPTAANVKYHAGIVREHAERRSVILKARIAIDAATRGEAKASEIAAGLANSLNAVAGGGERGFREIRTAVGPALQLIEDRGAGRIAPGVPTGHTAIDSHIGGYRGGDLVIVASVPGGGKTALALQWLINAAYAGFEGAMVSAEMSMAELVERALGNIGLIDSGTLRKGQLNSEDWGRLGTAADVLAKLPLHVDESPRPSIEEVCARVRALKAKHPDLRIVAVDFIQLIRSGSEEMIALALTNITYDLKGLAKELDIVVVATCQVDASAVEKSETPRPRLHHLRWSQGIREGADFVAMVYRPRMYDPSAEDVLELFFEKARALPTFEAKLQWQGAFMRVVDHDIYRRAA